MLSKIKYREKINQVCRLTDQKIVLFHCYSLRRLIHSKSKHVYKKLDLMNSKSYKLSNT